MGAYKEISRCRDVWVTPLIAAGQTLDSSGRLSQSSAAASVQAMQSRVGTRYALLCLDCKQRPRPDEESLGGEMRP